MTEKEREALGLSLTQDIQSAAAKLIILAANTDDDEASNNYTDWGIWFRDWADQFFPSKEDWPANVIRFPIERRV